MCCNAPWGAPSGCPSDPPCPRSRPCRVFIDDLADAVVEALPYVSSLQVRPPHPLLWAVRLQLAAVAAPALGGCLSRRRCRPPARLADALLLPCCCPTCSAALVLLCGEPVLGRRAGAAG